MRKRTVYLDGQPLSDKDALLHIIDILSESASADTPLAESELTNINSIVNEIRTDLDEIDQEDLYRALLACYDGIAGGTHTSSGHSLARVMFSIGEVLQQQGDFKAINILVMFCSDALFALYLHEPVYYRYITYAFYSICGGHDRIENKGYFDTMRYVERKRGYNGMEIDFMDMTAYYARLGIHNRQTPLELHSYYEMLAGIYDWYRAMTDGITGRYTEPGAVSLYDYCMKKLPVDGDQANPFVWPGAAYMVALHMGAYKKRLRVAKLYHATKQCTPTDLDFEERKWALRRIFAVFSILSVCGLGLMKVFNLYNNNPYRFYLAAGFAAFIGVFVLLSAFGNRGNGRFMLFFNPWSGWSHGIGYFL